MNQTIHQFIDARSQQLTEIRRYIHQHPELSGTEVQTTNYLADELRSRRLDPKPLADGRGLVIDLGPTDARRRLVLRADIDAIPVHDTKTVDYRSTIENVMHACGHDAHSTMLLGALCYLRDWFQEHPETDCAIRAIFQPEEETAQGARSLIQQGVLENADAVFGLHVDPSREVGSVGVREGVITAHCDEVLIKITGKGGHAARPHQCIDPIFAATQFINSVYAAVNRNVDSQESVVLTFGQFVGGHGSNVIPDVVQLKGTLRTLSSAARQATVERVNQIAAGIGMASGAKFEVEFGIMVPSVISDPAMTQIARRACVDLFGDQHVTRIPKPSMGGEDFAFYTQQLPAAFIRLGCSGPETGHLPLHNSGFDIDERALAAGAKVMARFAIEYLDE